MPGIPLLVLITALLGTPARPPGRRGHVEDLLARARATYAQLKTYADSGTVEVPYGHANDPSHEVHAFRTYYRAPRLFFFEFTRQAGTDRLVVWSDLEAFHSWWKSTGSLTDYPKGQGTTAFLLAESSTSHSVTQIAPLLFSTAGLTGTLTELGDVTAERIEMVGGYPCHKLIGVAQSTYGKTGHVVNVRRTTIWVDTASYLVRKVFEDSPAGTPASLVSRVTTTFTPHANPALSDERFRFAPPTQ